MITEEELKGLANKVVLGKEHIITLGFDQTSEFNRSLNKWKRVFVRNLKSHGPWAYSLECTWEENEKQYIIYYWIKPRWEAWQRQRVIGIEVVE